MSGPSVGVLLQARMGSSRLPGKVLMELAGRPMLWHIFDRLQRTQMVDSLVVATSVEKPDDAVAEAARAQGVEVFRGSEDDVADRFWRATETFQFGHVVRATADNPFVDPVELERTVEAHLREGADYTHNCFETGLPVGVGIEVYRADLLRTIWAEAKESRYREHLNPFVLEYAENLRIVKVEAPPEKRAPGLRLTVDTLEDLRLARRLYKALYLPGEIVKVDEVIRLLVREGAIAGSARSHSA